MKRIYQILFIATAISIGGNVWAQDGKPVDDQPAETPRPMANQPMDVRTNALRQLGLSREQAQQIRRINMARKPQMDAAQQRLREANRSLDDAIYADQISDPDFQARLKEVQLAQAEVAKIRFASELAVRRILTPEQLVRFRDLRARFEQARQDFENRRQPGETRQMREPNNSPSVQNLQRPAQRFLRKEQPRPLR